MPGYDIRLVDEEGKPASKGEIGELQVSGPTGAAYYWNNRDKSRSTFLGPWTRNGDKYSESDDGYFVYSGRNDDMLKVGGIWVSPFKVEAAVVGQADENGLVKPKAYVVLRPNTPQAPELAANLQQHVKGRLAPYKYPRWIEFVTDCRRPRRERFNALSCGRGETWEKNWRSGVLEYWAFGFP